ncbi:hypothetical protein GpartN1_g3945.t1 [Galdieria partita]|uniref:Uncharacterized protein n=1 Tax=Galdieria partita TaxID=83374 RepID=A0A9C7PXT6_9RHOD|nr:hypothetical protein GpartN1_g3945.t1 [Galdieria partita]
MKTVLYSVILVILLSLLHEHYFLNSWKVHVTYPECIPLRKRNLPLLVVVPFTKKDWYYIEKNLRLYSSYSPCSTNFDGTVDILFWFHRNWTEWDRNRTALKVLFESEQLKSCFRSVLVGSANLKPNEDLYYYSFLKLSHYSPGTCNMFYPLFKKNFIRNGYDYLFIMEPDVSPIRSLWLEAVHNETKGKVFYQKGSIAQYAKRITTQHDYHINGNALYRIGDPCFDRILETAQKTYKDAPFDGALHALRMNKRYHAWMRYYSHLFIYSDFILNFGDNTFSEQHILDKWPNTFLVHGKGRLNTSS